MLNQTLSVAHRGQTGTLYAIQPSGPVREFIFTSPESRRICNDPLVAGTMYTSHLRSACSKALQSLKSAGAVSPGEANSIVLHILRGGLNFGLREALSDAFGFSLHASAFISAQRARSASNAQDWVITENAYQKLSLHTAHDIIFGDVVATGTSLEHALERTVTAARLQGAEIRSLLFFTIGSIRSTQILTALDDRCRALFPAYRSATVVYLEGVFAAATQASPLRIKIDGTDLLRRDSLLAPEFITSQYEAPTYPLERCTIYDAGSRSFDPGEYFADVAGYWNQTLQLGAEGVTFAELVQERCPAVDPSRFAPVDLASLCRAHLTRMPRLGNRPGPKE